MGERRTRERERDEGVDVSEWVESDDVGEQLKRMGGMGRGAGGKATR